MKNKGLTRLLAVVLCGCVLCCAVSCGNHNKLDMSMYYDQMRDVGYNDYEDWDSITDSAVVVIDPGEESVIVTDSIDDVETMDIVDDTVDSTLFTRNTHELVQTTLKNIGARNIKTEMMIWGRRIWFSFRSESMCIDVKSKSVNIILYDLYWDYILAENGATLVGMWNAINEMNQQFEFKVIYSRDIEGNYRILSRRELLFIEEIPDRDAYLIAAIENMVDCHRYFERLSRANAERVVGTQK